MSTTPTTSIPPEKKSKNKKKKANGTASPITSTAATEAATTLLNVNPEGVDPANMEEALKEISKRERRLKKKLAGIELVEQKIKDLTDEEKLTTSLINSDERRKISEKPIYNAVYKELKEVLEFVTRADANEEKLLALEKERLAAEHAEKILEAKEEVRNEARAEAKLEADNNLRLLLSFLRTVSVRRSQVAMGHPSDAALDDAFEAALHLVYEANEKGFSACQNLFKGADIPVKDGIPEVEGQTPVTWATLKSECMCFESSPAPQEVPDVPEAEEHVAEVEPEATVEPDSQEAPTDVDVQPPEELTVEVTPTEDVAISTGGEAVEVAPAPPAETEPVQAPTPVNPIEESTPEPAGWSTEAAGSTAEPSGWSTEPSGWSTEPATSGDATTEPQAPAVTEASSEATANVQADVATDSQPKPAEEVSKTNGEYRKVEGRGGHRGMHRGGHRGRGEHRGDGYRPRQDYRGGYRGDGGRGYGGRGGDRGGYRGGRGEGYSGGRGGGNYRGRGGFQQNQPQHQQPQQQQPQQQQQQQQQAAQSQPQGA